MLGNLNGVSAVLSMHERLHESKETGKIAGLGGFFQGGTLQLYAEVTLSNEAANYYWILLFRILGIDGAIYNNFTRVLNFSDTARLWRPSHCFSWISV